MDNRLIRLPETNVSRLVEYYHTLPLKVLNTINVNAPIVVIDEPILINVLPTSYACSKTKIINSYFLYITLFG